MDHILAFTLGAGSAATIAALAILAVRCRRARSHAHDADTLRGAALLATIGQTARNIGTLESRSVLAAVADAAIALHYDAVEVCRFDDTGETYRIIESRGLPQEYVEKVHSTSTPMTRLVRERHATVVVDDYGSDPAAVPILRDAGFVRAIGVPVWSGGKLAAVLIAGSRSRKEFTIEDLQAFELLAIQASVALENARRFEDEQRAVQRLNDLDRMKDDFLSTVSHELRTPLTAIEAAGFTLEQRWDEIPDEMKMQLLSRLNANARTLESIITSLLDFSRMTGGRPNASMQTIDLSLVLEAAATRVGPLFAERSLAVAIAPNLIVNGDAMLIDRVIENLLSNAAKHTPKGSRVFVRALRTQRDVTVSVSDDGPGIPADELAHLSDRFFRGRHASDQRTRGLGLGLALVREILAAHGSKLEIHSTPGAGARFSFTMQLLAAKAPDANAAHPSSAARMISA